MNSAQILFENESLLAVAKPSGQAVIPGRGLPEEPLTETVARYLGKPPFVVHRIDREASGVVIFAKTPKAHQELCGYFERRKVRKKYLAAVLGTVEGEGSINSALREFGSGRTALDKTGKPSMTRYKAAQRLRGATLLEIDLITGRRHQIRVHLYSLGHPILGDPLYGKAPRPVGGAKRLMLHCLEITLPIPGLIPLRAEPPADFQKILSNFF